MTAVRLAVAVIAVLVLGTGCAAIPTSSPVVPVGPLTSEPQGAGVVGPKDGATPEEIVRGFIRLANTPADQHAAARAYLTAAAARTWVDDTEVAVFVGDNPMVAAAPSDGQGPVQVQVKAGQVGWLDSRGAFNSSRAAALSPTPLMTLERENGQWRIASLRDGLLMSQPSFQASYQPISLKFFDDTRNILVADPRWIPYVTEEGELGRAVELLLAGPSAAVRAGVYHPLEGVTLRTNVTVNDRGVLVVDLVVNGDLKEDRRRQIGAQVVSSLESIWDKPIQIMVNTVPLVARKAEWTVQDASPYLPATQTKPDLPVLGVTGAGTLLQIDGQVPFETGVQLTLASGSRSADGDQFALVSMPGPDLRQLWIGTLESLQPVSPAARSMTRPSWRTGSSREVWTVVDDRYGVVVTVPADAAELPRVGRVALDQLGARTEPITELRLSRDGHRVAVVVAGRLYVAVVSRASGLPVVVSPQWLEGPSGLVVADVDWRDAHRVVVAASLNGDPKIYSVSIDGASWQDHGTSKLTGPLAGIAADSSNRVYVSENSPDSRGLWSAALTDRPDWTRVMESYVDPFYPG